MPSMKTVKLWGLIKFLFIQRRVRKSENFIGKIIESCKTLKDTLISAVAY